MFETIDTFDTDTIGILNQAFPNAAEMFPADLAIVSRDAWDTSDKPRRSVERALIQRARELAEAGWCHAAPTEGPGSRCGKIVLHGDGTVWVTVRFLGDRVSVLVAVEAESIRDGLHPVLDAVKRAAVVQARVWLADWNARESIRIARRVFRNSPLIESDGRKRHAAGVPGALPWAGEHAMWIQKHHRYAQEAQMHRETLRNATVTLEAAIHRSNARAMEGGAA
jgi:hypothetical protein